MAKKKIIEPVQPHGEVSLPVLLYVTLGVLIIVLIFLGITMAQVYSLKKEIQKQESSQSATYADDEDDVDTEDADDSEEDDATAAEDDDAATTNKNTNSAGTTTNANTNSATMNTSTTNTNTASTNSVDWETFEFSNDFFAYSIEYPSTWELDGFVEPADSAYFGANPKGYVVPANTGSTVAVIVSVISTLEDKKKYYKDLGYSEQMITFAGVESYQYTLVDGGKNKKTIIVPSGDQLFEIGTRDSNIEYVDEIFSSFKIVK